MTEQPISRICSHCGSVGEERLGHCDECGLPVCVKCGNVHYVRGERKVLHDDCLKDNPGAHFSMIKFVK